MSDTPLPKSSRLAAGAAAQTTTTPSAEAQVADTPPAAPVGKRYCTSHGGEVPADAGSHVMGNKTTRWICNRCQAQRRQASAQR